MASQGEAPLPGPGARGGAQEFFRDLLGIEILELGEGRSRERLPPKEGLLNPGGVIHGGAVATLLDSTLSAALRSTSPGMRAVTIDLHVHFLLPARGEVVATGEAVRLGGTVGVARGEARDAAGQVVAIASGTFRLFAPSSTS